MNSVRWRRMAEALQKRSSSSSSAHGSISRVKAIGCHSRGVSDPYSAERWLQERTFQHSLYDADTIAAAPGGRRADVVERTGLSRHHAQRTLRRLIAQLRSLPRCVPT